MRAVAFVDPLGTAGARVEWEGPAPSYADGSAQAVRAAAQRALAEHLNVPLNSVRVTLMHADAGSAVWAVLPPERA